MLGQFIRRLSGFAAGEDTPQSALSAFLILENYYISTGSVKNGARRRDRIQNRTVEQTLLSEEEIQEEQEKMRRMKDVPYTKDKMRHYAEKYKIQGRVRAVDLPLDSKEDAIADVAAAAFAPANNMDVYVDDHYIRTDKIQLRDFTLTDRVPAEATSAGTDDDPDGETSEV